MKIEEKLKIEALRVRIEELENCPNKPPRLLQELAKARHELAMGTIEAFLGVVKGSLGGVYEISSNAIGIDLLGQKMVSLQVSGGVLYKVETGAPMGRYRLGCLGEKHFLITTSLTACLFSDLPSAQARVDKYRWTKDDVEARLREDG